jgi:arylsulfatase A
MAINGRILAECAFIIGASTGWMPVKAADNHKKLNIVIFLADDLGYGDLACYGNPIIKSPNIDRFSTQGVLLTDCHSGGTVSSPSRAALLTGRNPYRSGFYYIQGGNTYLSSDEVTIAEVLKTRGYETFFAGKWHLSTLEKNSRNEPGPGDQGFDYWMGTTHNPFEGPRNSKAFIRNGKPVGEVNGWYCDVVVDEASAWLREKRDTTKPFFLYLASHEPHTPFSPPEKYSEMYNNPKVDSLEKTIKYGGVGRPEKNISANKKEYYGTVSQLDNAFGRLVKTIDDLGLGDNTMIIFTSDNGPETPVTNEESQGKWDDPIREKCFGTPGIFRGMKRYPYEGGHRVPGIVRLPGVIPAGSRSDKLFNGTDFFPTICKMLDIPLPKNKTIDGTENFNAFLNKDIKRKNPVIWFYPHYGDTYSMMPQMSMRQGNFVLIGWLPVKPDSIDLNAWFFKSNPVKYELYNIIDDPGQGVDLAKKRPEIVSSLSIKMTKLWIEMRDEGLKKNRIELN